MSGHTPGPWTPRGADTYRWQIETADAPKVATVIARVCTPRKGGSTTADANARLIAAAPEMFAALLMVTDTLIKLAPYPPEVAEGVIAIVEDAREALEKARGKQP